MRHFYFVLLLGSLQHGYGQSKKDQIGVLTLKVDSLNQVLTELKSQLSQKEASNEALLKENIVMQQTIKESQLTLNKVERNLSLINDSVRKLVTQNKLLPLVTNSKYAGNYSFDNGNGSGALQMYFDGKEEYYFYLEYIKGPPSYNMGALEGIMKIYGNTGVFNASLSDETTCQITFVFDESGVFINQLSDDFACGFGGNVIISNKFFKEDSENKKITPNENSSGTYTRSTNKW